MTESLAPPLPPETASDDEFLLAFLDSHESPCPACGYNCHKVQTPRCPECGITLTLRLISLNPMRKSWGVAMVGASLGAGVGVLLLVLIAAHGWPKGPPTEQAKLVLFFGYFFGMILGTLLLLVFRRRFERLPGPLRVAISTVLLLLTLVMVAWLAKEG